MACASLHDITPETTRIKNDKKQNQNEILQLLEIREKVGKWKFASGASF
jgi:hypothetical protein